MLAYRTWLNGALVGGALLFYLMGRRRGLPLALLLDLVLGGILAGLLGARAGYVALNWAYFRDHLGEAIRLWQGGLNGQIGLLVGLLATGPVCALHRTRWLPILDLLAVPLALGSGLAWLACDGAGCAWGRPVYPADGLLWRLSADLPDLYGLQEPRVAVQRLAAGGNGLLALLLWWTSERPGRRFALYLVGTGGLFLILGGWRGDPMPALGGWRLDQLLGLAMLLAGLALGWGSLRRGSR